MSGLLPVTPSLSSSYSVYPSSFSTLSSSSSSSSSSTDSVRPTTSISPETLISILRVQHEGDTKRRAELIKTTTSVADVLEELRRTIEDLARTNRALEGRLVQVEGRQTNNEILRRTEMDQIRTDMRMHRDRCVTNEVNFQTHIHETPGIAFTGLPTQYLNIAQVNPNHIPFKVVFEESLALIKAEAIRLRDFKKALEICPTIRYFPEEAPVDTSRLALSFRLRY